MLNADTSNLVTPDGVVLRQARFLPAEGGRLGVVVSCNSQAQHIGNLAPTFQGLADHGFDVHAADLRGHGQSSSRRAPLGHMDVNGGWDKLVDDFRAVLANAFDGVPWEDRIVATPNIGALLTLEVLKTWPDLAKHIVLVNPPSNQPVLHRLAQSVTRARLLLHLGKNTQARPQSCDTPR